MQAWSGLIGVLAGAVIAIAGQRLAFRSQVQDARRLVLLEQCSQIVALSEDYRNRLWEERHQIAADAISAWDLPAYRLAEARLRILAPSSELIASLTDLDETGAAAGGYWRTTHTDGPKLDEALRAHRRAIEAFVALSSKIVP